MCEAIARILRHIFQPLWGSWVIDSEREKRKKNIGKFSTLKRRLFHFVIYHLLSDTRINGFGCFKLSHRATPVEAHKLCLIRFLSLLLGSISNPKSRRWATSWKFSRRSCKYQRKGVTTTTTIVSLHNDGLRCDFKNWILILHFGCMDI